MRERTFALGVDYGTNSVRGLVVDTVTGAEVGSCVWDYPTGEQGVVLDPAQPDLARQHPRDYLKGLEASVRGALAKAAKTEGFSHGRVIGIGVDTTGSTPIPVDALGEPLAMRAEFPARSAAFAWLWKDHTAHAEATKITESARRLRLQYLAKCGGVYSSEWFWSKVLRCRREAPDVFEAAHTWVECADWIPAVLTGRTATDRLARCICAAGHKAMFHPSWGGYPDEEFLAAVDPALVRVRRTLPSAAVTIADTVGGLTAEWAARLELPQGIPVAGGAFDAHLGAVGSGTAPGTMVKILGTSSCDMAVAPPSERVADIPGRMRDRPGVHPARAPRHRGGAVRGRRRLQPVRPAHPAGERRRRARGAEPGGGRASTRRKRPAGARLAQREPDGPGGPASERNGARADAAYDSGRAVPCMDRGDGLRRPDDRRATGGVRCADPARGRLRRHFCEECAGAADLRRRPRPAAGGGPERADLRAGRGDGRRGGRRAGARRACRFRRRRGGNDGRAGTRVPPRPVGGCRLRRIVRPLSLSPRRLRPAGAAGDLSDVMKALLAVRDRVRGR